MKKTAMPKKDAKVSTDCIYRWIKSGKIPALRVSKMVTRIPRVDYEMFLRKYMKQNKEKNDLFRYQVVFLFSCVVWMKSRTSPQP